MSLKIHFIYLSLALGISRNLGAEEYHDCKPFAKPYFSVSKYFQSLCEGGKKSTYSSYQGMTVPDGGDLYLSGAHVLETDSFCRVNDYLTFFGVAEKNVTGSDTPNRNLVGSIVDKGTGNIVLTQPSMSAGTFQIGTPSISSCVSGGLSWVSCANRVRITGANQIVVVDKSNGDCWKHDINFSQN